MDVRERGQQGPARARRVIGLRALARLETLRERPRGRLRCGRASTSPPRHRSPGHTCVAQVTRERIRQIEAKAIRRLKSRDRSAVLLEYTSCGDMSVEQALAPATRRPGLGRPGR